MTGVRKDSGLDSITEEVYRDIGFFKIVFDLISAYGTCGYSLGYKNRPYSFAGALRPESQFLLVVTMFLGRIRGLPDSIDCSVRLYRAEDVFDVALKYEKNDG